MIKFKHFITLSLATIALAACAPATTPQAVSVSPTFEPAVTLEAPTETAIPAATEFVDYCLDCHSDKDQLVSLAKPEPETESESKGVG